MKEHYHFVAISGSLRSGSLNTQLLNAAQALVPKNITIKHLFIGDVPLYNEDLYGDKKPDAVEKLCNEIKAADAVIFVTPEYNYSIPGVLKNVIDFLSKSPKKPLDKKPVGIMGASPSMFGTARAQYHLRQIMVAVNAHVLNKPEVMVAQAHQKFDETGNIKDEETTQFVKTFITELAAFSDAING